MTTTNFPFRQQAARLESSATTRACRFDTGTGCGKHLARTEAIFRIEGPTEPLHHRQIGGAEHAGHEIQLFDADAMFAGHAAAHLQTGVQNLLAGSQHALNLIRVAFIEKQDGVKIAVAGMKDIADANLVFFADLPNESQHFR